MTAVITIHLIEGHDLIFRESDGSQADIEARLVASKIVTVNVTHPEENALDLCERVFAITNGMPSPGDEDATEFYYSQRARSLSVGDLLFIPEHGYYAVANMGFTPLTLEDS